MSDPQEPGEGGLAYTDNISIAWRKVGHDLDQTHLARVNASNEEFLRAVTVMGLDVAPGDFVHADRHGAVVIPKDVLPKLAGAIRAMQASEAVILGPAREPGFDIEAFEKAWDAFEKSRI